MTRSSSEMTGPRLLVELRRRGLTVAQEGDRLRVAPKNALTPEVRETLASRKGDLFSALSLEARILSMPLDRFERERRSLEVRVPWLPETLWFVPGERQVESLTKQGVGRGRIWTVRELLLLYKLPSLDRRRTQEIGQVKARLGGEIVSVEGPDPMYRQGVGR